MEIFFTFVIKDTVYYFILWVLPFVGGFAIALQFIGIPLALPALPLITLTLAFISIVYTRSKTALGLTLGRLLLVVGLPLYLGAGINIALLFPPLILFHTFSWGVFGLICVQRSLSYLLLLYCYLHPNIQTSRKDT